MIKRMWLRTCHELLHIAKERASLRDPVWAPKETSESHSSWICSLEPEVLPCPEKCPILLISPLECKLQMTGQILTIPTLLKLPPEMELPRVLRSRTGGDSNRARLGEPQQQRPGSAAPIAPQLPGPHRALSLLPLILNHRVLGLCVLQTSGFSHHNLTPLGFPKCRTSSWLGLDNYTEPISFAGPPSPSHPDSGFIYDTSSRGTVRLKWA